MSTVLLVRHGLTALTGQVLAGRAPGVHLDARGEKQAAALAERIAAVPITAIVTSPLERCVETAQFVLAAQRGAGREPQWQVDDLVTECGYGAWTGQSLKDLAKDPLWKIVQAQPSAARFPEGESLSEMSARAIAAVRDWDRRLGPDEVWVACSHGDVIKAVVADALGLHLDQFQRIAVDPCSVSVVRYTESRPYLLRLNDVGGSLGDFAVAKRRTGRSRKQSSATVGGGAGSGQV